MEWCKLYATFATDPKIQPLSDRAFRAYVEAMCYATLQETDGQFYFRNKGVDELVNVGLVDVDLDGGRFLHGWVGRQRSKGELDHERQRSRERSRRHRDRTAEDVPIQTRGEVEETRLETAKQEPATRVDPNPHQPTDRQMYFGDKLDIGVPAIVKLNKKHGREFVLSAMEQVHGFPPEDDVQSAYAYVDSVASFKKAGAA